jgi:putative zinc finger/helix-turn-helix YgiT family protein
MTEKKFCPYCEDEREVKPAVRTEKYTVRGREITVRAKTDLCALCGGDVGSMEQDDKILTEVYDQYRKREGLLTPSQIQRLRKRYRLSQKSFAALLGMSEATVKRYEGGALQEQAHDTAIRACESPTFMRGLLQRRGHLLSDWRRKQAMDALQSPRRERSKTVVRG